jgi:hypothetical protein
MRRNWCRQAFIFAGTDDPNVASSTAVLCEGGVGSNAVHVLPRHIGPDQINLRWPRAIAHSRSWPKQKFDVANLTSAFRGRADAGEGRTGFQLLTP